MATCLQILVLYIRCLDSRQHSGCLNVWNWSRPEKPDSAGRHRLFATIIVEAALGFSPEPTGLDIFHQERTGPVLGILESLIQHLHDRETRIEPDKIGKLQRTHRVMGAEPHGGVDGVDRTHALIE